MLVVEDLAPFLEENVKVLAAEFAAEIGGREFHGKRDGSLPGVGEIDADAVTEALRSILGVEGGPPFPEYREQIGTVGDGPYPAAADDVLPRLSAPRLLLVRPHRHGIG